MLRNNILATLAYYDALDLPLKAEEIFNFLIKKENDDIMISLPDIKKELDQLVLEKIIDVDQKYYYLTNRDFLVPLRLKKYLISQKKWLKAIRVVKWLAHVPYIETVFASGTLAMNNCDELSDLDLLIIVKHGKIWLGRLFVTAIISILGVRRRWNHIIAPDKICLNHYITDKSLKIPFENIYNAQTYANLKPILTNNDDTLNKFFY